MEAKCICGGDLKFTDILDKAPTNITANLQCKVCRQDYTATYDLVEIKMLAEKWGMP